MKFLLTTIALVWCWMCCPVQAQNFFNHYENSLKRKLLPYYSIPTYDNGRILVSIQESTIQRVRATKIDAQGVVEWVQVLVEHPTLDIKPRGVVQLPSDSSYVIAYDSVQTEMMVRLSPAGAIQYKVPVDGGLSRRVRDYRTGMAVTSDEHLLILNSSAATNVPIGMVVTKYDLQGNFKWSHLYDSDTNRFARPNKLIEAADGSYYLAGEVDYSVLGGAQTADLQIFKLDTSGNVLWKRSHVTASPTYETHMVATADGGYTLAVYSEDTAQTAGNLLIHVDAQGQRVYREPSEVNGGLIMGLVQQTDGTYSILSRFFWQQRNFYVSRHSNTGQLIQTDTIVLVNNTGIGVPESFDLVNETYHLLGTTLNGVTNQYSFYWTIIDSIPPLPPNRILGCVYDDVNLNCQLDSGEQALPYVRFELTTPMGIEYITSNASGQYEAFVGSGTFVIRPDNSYPYRRLCLGVDTVTFTGTYMVDTAHFGVETRDSCAFMEVDISAPFLRRCFPSAYYVQYYNRGTQTADSVAIEVTLDPYLTYVSSGITPTSQVGNTLLFDVGAVEALEEGRFEIIVAVGCDSVAIGQVHCSEARIYPDFFCSDPWLGPRLELMSHCDQDTVVFELTNTGGAMATTSQYNVIEEHVMIYSAPFQLGAGGTQTIRVPATNGWLYRVEAHQVPGYPRRLGGLIVAQNHLSCDSVPAPLQTPDILDEFVNDNGNPFVAVDCQANIGSYDPNDKQAQPRGYDPAHYILNNTPIQYRLRFQNTGTDTAFTVVLVDTLDTDFDPMSIQLGASSHPYTWSLSGSGILTVRFDNIILPDSNVNEPLSHGFVKFQIDQDPNLPNGTQLTNRAAIYFDFNPPIITNEVFHTIGSSFMEVLVLGLEEPLIEEVTARLYPNPFRKSATLEVTGRTYERLTVEVYSVAGQRVHIFQGSGNQLAIDRRGLSSGIYFYRLIGDKERIATGKLIIE